MLGRLIGVVGPSGVGKDSVMEAMAAARADMFLIRRVITRAEDLGGEVYDTVSDAVFEDMAQSGIFALHWSAHGMRYGVPWTELTELDVGRIGLVNLSRSVLQQAETLFDRFTTLNLTAPEEVLAQRLAVRGRENAEEIKQRLQRANFALPTGLGRVVEIANDGAMEKTVANALDALQAERV